MSESQHPLDALEQAIENQRLALLNPDADGLLAATKAELEALEALEKSGLDNIDPERLKGLGEKLRRNVALLGRRRREVSWMLDQVGVTDAAGTYQANGTKRVNTQLRSFGAA